MNSVIEDISKKTGYPPDAIVVVASAEGLKDTDKDYAKNLKSKVTKSLSADSSSEFKLKSIAEILKKDHTEVLKASVSCGARLSKDAGGEFWVVGCGLVSLINKMNGVEAPVSRARKPEKGRETDKKIEKIRAEKPENIKIPAEEENRQLDLNDILGEGTINLKPEEDKMPRKAAVKEEAVETVKEPAKKPAAKSAKASLKALVNSNTEMDVAKARKFLVNSKLKKLEEVAFMSDAEVSKIVNKDYAFLTVGNGSESLNIAIPKEELKKIDLSSIAVI